MSDQDSVEPAAPSSVRDQEAKPGRRRRNWATILVGFVTAVVVAAAGFAGAMLQPYLADRAVVATKLAIARAATNAITTLWTYTPEDVESLPDRASKFLTGDFEARYRKFLDAVVAANKQAKISVTTQVTGVAVESLEGIRATAIVFTNTSTTSPQTKGIPALQYRANQITLTRTDGRWLATELANITKFSLTPQF